MNSSGSLFSISAASKSVRLNSTPSLSLWRRIWRTRNDLLAGQLPTICRGQPATYGTMRCMISTKRNSCTLSELMLDSFFIDRREIVHSEEVSLPSIVGIDGQNERIKWHSRRLVRKNLEVLQRNQSRLIGWARSLLLNSVKNRLAEFVFFRQHRRDHVEQTRTSGRFSSSARRCWSGMTLSEILVGWNEGQNPRWSMRFKEISSSRKDASLMQNDCSQSATNFSWREWADCRLRKAKSMANTRFAQV